MKEPSIQDFDPSVGTNFSHLQLFQIQILLKMFWSNLLDFHQMLLGPVRCSSWLQQNPPA